MDRRSWPLFFCPPANYSPVSLCLSPLSSLSLSVSLSVCFSLASPEPVYPCSPGLELVGLDNHGATCPTERRVFIIEVLNRNLVGTSWWAKRVSLSAPLTSAPLNILTAFFAPPIVAITTSAVAAGTNAQPAANQRVTRRCVKAWATHDASPVFWLLFVISQNATSPALSKVSFTRFQVMAAAQHTTRSILSHLVQQQPLEYKHARQ